MKRTFKIATLLSVVMLMLLSVSYTLAAPPTDKAGPQSGNGGQMPQGPTGMWMDNFDSYAPDTSLHGLNGWEGWANDPAATAYTRNAQAHSAPNSVEIVGSADLVHPSNLTTGTYSYTGWMYIPTDYAGQTYLIFLNTYPGSQSSHWSAQLMFDAASNTIISDEFGVTTPFVRGQWAPWVLTVNLDSDTQTFTYNNTVMYADQPWSTANGPTGGSVRIAAIDLFANTGTTVYYDDLALVQGNGATPTPTMAPTATTPPTAIEMGTVEAGSAGTPVLPLALLGLALVAGLLLIRRR